MSTDGSLCILVVEDDAIVRGWISGYLEAEGYSVLQASSGDQAVACLQNGNVIDILFTDIRLGPGLNGWDVAEVARQERPDIRVVYTSGHLLAPRRDVPGSLFLDKPYAAVAVGEACRGDE
jgi:CheY-like chemotaxis protein